MEACIPLMQTARCFQRLVRDTLLFVLNELLGEATEITSYIKSKGLENKFKQSELHIFANSRKPSDVPLTLLCKVLDSCPYFDDNDSQSETISNLLKTLLLQYETFLKNFWKLNATDCDNMMTIITESCDSLIEASGRRNWKEFQIEIKSRFLFAQNVNINNSSCEDLMFVETQLRNDRLCLLFDEQLSHLTKDSWHITRFRPVLQTSNQELISAVESVDIPLDCVIGAIIPDKTRCVTICGDHGIGKSIFAISIIKFWLNEDIKQLYYFDYVVHISSHEFSQDITMGNLLEVLFPLSSSINLGKLKEYIKSKKILLVLDDAEVLEVNQRKELTQVPNFHVILLGQMTLEEQSYGNLYYLAGLSISHLMDMCHWWTLQGEIISMKDLIHKNINRFKTLLRYPSVMKRICDIWDKSHNFFSRVHTVSDLIWLFFTWIAQHELNIDVSYPNDKTKRFYELLRICGSVSGYALCKKCSISQEAVKQIQDESLKLFPVTGEKFLDCLLEPRIVHRKLSSFDGFTLGGNPFLEFLNGWFIVKEILNKKQLPVVSTGSVISAAGHISRLESEGNITIVEEKKLIKPLVQFSKTSYEDFEFIFQFVTELKCIKRLVQLVIDNTEYDVEWSLYTNTLQLNPLKILLSYVSPVRLVFMIDEHTEENVEIDDILEYTCRVKLSVWLDSSTQFDYGNPMVMDKFLKPFMEKRVVPKLDLLAGQVSTCVLSQLPKTGATGHLVLLKLRVCDEEMLHTVLALPDKLYKLLWLEIKVDFDVNNISLCKIKQTSAPLFDVHFRGITMEQVGHFADLLMCMHSRFTGIHLERTEFTPEGVYTLLKEIGKRNVALSAEKEYINKFRRWYYPNIHCIPRWKPLTEEQLIDLIGYDDIEFFSDHKVESTRFVTALDSWNLTNYLESEDNIIHFCYEASNMTFTKHLDGNVETAFRGEYWDSIQESTRKMSDIHKDLSIVQSSPAFNDIYG